MLKNTGETAMTRQEALTAAFLEAIRSVGMAGFKKTSMFGSNGEAAMTAPETIYINMAILPDDVWTSDKGEILPADSEYILKSTADARVAAAYEAAAQIVTDAVSPFTQDIATAIRALATQPQTDALQAMIDAALTEAREKDAIAKPSSFDSADWFWRPMDPDDNADNPAEVIHRAYLGPFVVCEIASSYRGPTRFGFNAPVLDLESDDEEFLHFETEAEAFDAAKTRIASLAKIGGA